VQPELTQRLGQRQVLAPQPIQSIKILAVNVVDFDAYIGDAWKASCGGITISSRRAQPRTRTLIESDPARRPISDGAIADYLYSEGIEIATFTVAKDIEKKDVPPSSQRRRQAGTTRHTRR